jgi:hypothetical protein
MKKNKLLLLLVITVLWSCATSENIKLRIEIPTKRAVSLDPYDEVIITNFFITKEPKDVDLNKDFSEYLTTEFERFMEKKITPTVISLEQEENFENSDFWKGQSQDSSKAVFFTGALQYSQETRKALLRKEKRKFEDPFEPEPMITARKFYNLQAQLYLIDAQSGEILYKKNFKESRSYENPNQTAQFALFDLIIQLKDKLLRNILGKEQFQERYLIIH